MDKNGIFPLVSVVIPGHNHARYLRQRVDSVLAQDYPNIEVILLDDCSTDDSADIMLSYGDNPKVSHVVVNEENTGNPFLQWTKGIELAQGDYVWIAESDDSAELDFISKLMTSLINTPDAVLAYSGSYFIDEKGKTLNYTWDSKASNVRGVIYDGKDFSIRRMVYTNRLYNASMIIFSKKVFYSLDRIFTKFRHGGDWLFWFEIIQHGKVCEVPEKLNYFRQHDNKVSNNAKKSGADFDENAAIQSIFIEKLHLSAYQQMCLRGRQTKRLKKLPPEQVQRLKEKYPMIYNGTLLDALVYATDKITGLSHFCR